MRAWRAVLKAKRFAAGGIEDLEVRRRLGVPSIDCLVRKRRLVYFARVLVSGFDELLSLMFVRGRSGELPKWTQTIVQDHIRVASWETC